MKNTRFSLSRNFAYDKDYDFSSENEQFETR